MSESMDWPRMQPPHGRRRRRFCRADDEHPGERDVRVRVGHAPEDRMIVEQSLEPPQI